MIRQSQEGKAMPGTGINQVSMLPFFAAVEQAALARVHGLGLSFKLGWNFEWYARMLEERSGIVSPTFDPSFRHIEPGSFWGILAQGENVVATMAFALFTTGDLRSRLRDQSLWFDRPEDHVSELGHVGRLPLTIAAPFLFGGASWAAPDWRGTGAVYALSVLCRHHMLRHVDAEYLAGFQLEPMVARNVGKRTYDYPPENVRLILDGFPPPFKQRQRMFALWMSRNEATSRLFHTGVDRMAYSPTVELKIDVMGCTTQTKREIRPVPSAIGSQRRS